MLRSDMLPPAPCAQTNSGSVASDAAPASYTAVVSLAPTATFHSSVLTVAVLRLGSVIRRSNVARHLPVGRRESSTQSGCRPSQADDRDASICRRDSGGGARLRHEASTAAIAGLDARGRYGRARCRHVRA